MESADGVGNSLRRKVREGLGSTKSVIETPVSVLVYQTRDRNSSLRRNLHTGEPAGGIDSMNLLDPAGRCE